MNNVVISIIGKQRYADSNEWDVTEFTTEGVYEKTEKGCRILYNEGDMIGAENVKSEVIIEDGIRAEIIRSGPVSSRMTVEKEKRHSCYYSTPEGDFTIGIFGQTIMTDFKDIANIYMSYTIDVNSSLISENIMEIKIKGIRQ